MGRLLNGINGPITGKVGTVHGSSWKGVPYLKGPYKKRTKKISVKEKNNRLKFGLSQAWLKPVLPFVREGFKHYTETVEGFVVAKSFLLKNAVEGTGAGISINPALVQVSFGNLPLSDNIAVGKTGDGKLQFTWDTTPVEGGSNYDQVMLLAYDIGHKKAWYNITGQFRSSGEDILPVPSVGGRTYHLWLAFTAGDRKRQSNSVYLGTIST